MSVIDNLSAEHDPVPGPPLDAADAPPIPPVRSVRPRPPLDDPAESIEHWYFCGEGSLLRTD